MIYHLFQNSVWKVVKIAKTSNLKSAVKSQSITTVTKGYMFERLHNERLHNERLHVSKATCFKGYMTKGYMTKGYAVH